MSKSVVYNCNCMEYMKSLPDKAFDLAVVDPPYGAGFTEGGGCKGWFTKYHQSTDDTEACSQILNVERERESGPRYNRFGSPGSRFERYKREQNGSEEQAESGEQTKSTVKKSSRGTLPQGKIISESFSASHAIRSFGAATISRFRRRAASSSGKS